MEILFFRGWLMIGKIIKSIFSNFQTFLVVWVVIIVANQLFIFGGCFAPYCLIAALPHTSIIAALVTYFINEVEKEKAASNEITDYALTSYSQPKKEGLDLNDFEDAKEPFCPKCGSKMILRTGKKGKYSGQKLWVCSNFPNCDGILNI